MRLGSADDYENPEIGLGLALDIDNFRPRPEDCDRNQEIVERWRLEDAFRELFAPGRKYYSKQKLLLVLEELLLQWQIELSQVLLVPDKQDQVIQFTYGVRNFRWMVRFKPIQKDSKVIRITETKCEREIPYVIRFRTRKSRTKPEYEQAQLLFLPDL